MSDHGAAIRSSIPDDKPPGPRGHVAHEPRRRHTLGLHAPGLAQGQRPEPYDELDDVPLAQREGAAYRDRFGRYDRSCQGRERSLGIAQTRQGNLTLRARLAAM